MAQDTAADNATLPSEPNSLDPTDSISEANDIRIRGNELFKSLDYNNALVQYQTALEICPEDAKPTRALIYGNISACYMQLQDYNNTVKYCSETITLDPNHGKARLRRSKANEKIDTWASLESACEDLRYIKSHEAEVGPQIYKDATRLLVELEPRLEKKKKQETDKLMAQLKDLGNGLLKNFGMSLDDIKFQQDGKGGYSVNTKK